MSNALLFSTQEARRIARVTFRQADYWIRTGLVRPTVNPKGSGRRRGWTFRDLIALRTIGSLKAAGVSLQAVRRVQRELVDFEGDDAALRSGRLVLEQGSKKPDVALAVDDATVMSLLKKPGQSSPRVVFEMEPVFAVVDEGVAQTLEVRAKVAARRKRAA